MGPHAPVQLNIRHPGERFVWRGRTRKPIAQRGTHHLHPDLTLRLEPPDAEADIPYDAQGDGLIFRTEPFTEETEITGPMSALLFVLLHHRRRSVPHRPTVRPGGEVTFEGSTDPNTLIANGWLRASHRAIDSERSRPWQPYHPHDRTEPLTPGKVVELEVEIVLRIVVPPGYRLGLGAGPRLRVPGSPRRVRRRFVYATQAPGG